MLNALRDSLIAAASLTCTLPAGAQSVRYGEPWRPGYHFSPEVHWMNEPNGHIYIAGENGEPGLWHLFYQHNPIANQFGRNQSWGHATSPDLVTWTHRPDALRPEITPAGPINAYSGGAVFDANNTSGLGTTDNPPYILSYTGHNAITRNQDQRLAYSLDRGNTWIHYAGNPIIDIGSREFRDPKIAWDSFYNRWIMVVTHGGQNFVSQWESNDLINWTRLDDFSDANIIAAGATGWEVPDLFRLPLNGGPVRPWVLQLTPANGSPAGGNGVLYWVGTMGERGFIPQIPAQWADYGRDFDGVYSWDEAPDGRRIWAGIMQSYGESIPTTPWRGQVSFPRELSLVTTPEGARLRQKPVEEIETLRMGLSELSAPAAVTTTTDPLAPLSVAGRMLDIEATFDMGSATIAGLRVLSLPGGSGFIGYSSASQEVFVDTRGAGRSDFSGAVAGVFSAPLDLGPDNEVHLRILLDRLSIEVFAGTPDDQGAVTISQLVLPDPNVPDDQLAVEATSIFGSATLLDFRAYELRETWSPYPLPAGNATIARWSMSPPPSPVVGSNPIVADSAVAVGQGSQLGEVNRFYEPSPSVDSLFYDSTRSDSLFITSPDVAPPSMFRPGESGGDASFDAASLAADDGAVTFDPDLYGREFEFTSGFTVEVYFRTHGDQSNAGLMEVLLQGDDQFRFALILNEGGPGNLRFAITDGLGNFPVVDSDDSVGDGDGDINLADGQWHYAAATYDPDDAVSPAGSLRLLTLSETLERREAVLPLPASFVGIRPSGAQSDGRLIVGRASDILGDDERTFLGLIDEIRISGQPLAPERLLGAFQEACDPDLDTDGQLTSNDVVEFLFRVQSASATGFNFFEFLEYLEEYDAGCPQP